MNQQGRRALQQILQSPAWPAVETFLEEYIRNHFHAQSLKRSSQFETLWQAAYSEGGKQTLYHFFLALEDEAELGS